MFAEWPAGGQIRKNTYAAQLFNHFVEALTVFDVPLVLEVLNSRMLSTTTTG